PIESLQCCVGPSLLDKLHAFSIGLLSLNRLGGHLREAQKGRKKYGQEIEQTQSLAGPGQPRHPPALPCRNERCPDVTETFHAALPPGIRPAKSLCFRASLLRTAGRRRPH